VPFHGQHRNRTLVLGGAQTGAHACASNETSSSESLVAHTPAKNALVTARTGGQSQLMTKETYEREKRQKQELQKKQQAVNDQQVSHSPHMQPATQQRILEFEGIKFRLQDDGSKLIRIPGRQTNTCTRYSWSLSHTDAASGDKETPRKVKVADIDFLRTKHGNLVRATSIQSNGRYLDRNSMPVSLDIAHSSPLDRWRRRNIARILQDTVPYPTSLTDQATAVGRSFRGSRRVCR
jgi:hypothetical protein